MGENFNKYFDPVTTTFKTGVKQKTFHSIREIKSAQDYIVTGTISLLVQLIYAEY